MRRRILAGMMAMVVSFTSFSMPTLAMEARTHFRLGSKTATQEMPGTISGVTDLQRITHAERTYRSLDNGNISGPVDFTEKEQVNAGTVSNNNAKVKEISISSGKSSINVTPDTYDISYDGITVSWAEETQGEVSDLGKLPLELLYNNSATGVTTVSDNNGYYTHTVQIKNSPYDVNIEQNIVHISHHGGQEGLPVGSHRFTFNVPDAYTEAGQKKSVTFTVVSGPESAATPVITGQPAGATYQQGASTVPLKVSATVSDDGGLTYLWYKNTTNSNTGGTALTGSTLATYTPPSGAVGTTYYYCVVTNTNNNATNTKKVSVATEPAEIIITEKNTGGNTGDGDGNESGDQTLTNAAKPVITTEPQDAEYGLKEVAALLTFSVSVNDGGTLTYQWYKGKTSNTLHGVKIEGATEPTYTPETSEAGIAYYYCEITNTNNEATSQKIATEKTRAAKIKVVEAEGSGTVSMNDWIYGQSHSLPQVYSETNDASKVVYSYSGTTNAGMAYGPSNRIPAEAGTYEVQATIAAVRDYKEVVVTDEFIIHRAPGAGSVVIDDWTYEEVAKLPKPTSEKNGISNVTYSYSGTSNAGVAYGPSAVAPRDAGNYTVQATFGIAPNYEQATATDSFIIHKAMGRATVSINDWDYGSQASSPMPQSETNGTDGVTYIYTGKTVSNETYGPVEEVPVLAGTYNVQAFFPGNYNYEPTTASADFVINRCAITMSSAQIPSKIYDGNISASYNSITFVDKNGENVSLAKDDYLIESVVYNDPNAGNDKVVTITGKLKNPNYVFAGGNNKLIVRDQVIDKTQGSITYKTNVSNDNEVVNNISLTEVLKSIAGYRGETSNLTYSVSYTGGKFTEMNVSGNTLSFRTIKDVEYDMGVAEVITISVSGLRNYHNVTITINAFIAPEDIWVDNFEKVFTYTGSKITQSIQVYDGDTLLKENKDYTLIYKNNLNAYEYSEQDTRDFKPNKAPQLIIKMKGNYTGSQTLYFKIMRANISGQGSSADDVYVTYTGKKQTPVPTVIWNNKKLKNTKDFYVLQYDQSRDDKNAFVGKPSTTTSERLTIVGKGNFVGEKYISHVVGRSDDTVKQVVITKASVKGVKALEWTKNAKYGEGIAQGKLTIKYKGKELKPSLDYTISYENNRSVGTATVVISGTGYDYDNDGIAFIGNKKINFKITGVNVSKANVSYLVKSGYAYTGKLIRPMELTAEENGGKAVELSYKKNNKVTTLVHGTDFTVSYKNNLDKGMATMIIDGNENEGFTGTKKVTFKIVPDSLGRDQGTAYRLIPMDEKLKGEGTENSPYVMPISKGGAKPKVIVVNAAGTELVEGRDYVVSYRNNKTVTDITKVEYKKAPTVVVKGKGNYTGAIEMIFSTEPKDNSLYKEVVVVAKDKVVSNKKNGWKQKVKVVDEDGKALTQKDYDAKNLRYFVKSVPGGGSLVGTELTQNPKAQVPVGTIIEVQATLSGNSFTGVAKGTYKIINAGYDLSKANFKLNPQSYTGEEIFITNKEAFKTAKIRILRRPVDLKIGEQYDVYDLEFGKDFEIVEGSYKNNIKTGTARFTIRAIEGSKYGGEKTITFKIAQRSILTYWDGILEHIMQMF